MQKLKISLLVALLLMGLIAHKAKAQTPGLEIKVQGKGQPVLMIPGLTCDGKVWDSTIAAMGDGYEYHVVTLPGFAGRAPIDHEGAFLQKMEGLLLDYIKEQKMENPVIIGHSLGGFLALNIGIQEPDLPSKLVIVDSLPFLPAIQMPGATAESAKPMAENMRNMMMSTESQSVEARIAQQKMMLRTMIRDDENIEIALDWGLKSDAGTVAPAMYELYTIDLREEISKIKAPTLVMGAYIAYTQYGVTRESTLKNYTDQYAKLDGVIVDLSDKGNHFIMWDDPEYVQAWLKKFL